MTTSLTDARYTSIHFTSSHLLSLSIDPPPETGWGVMPGYDQSIPIPPHLEPPRLDADETLPSQIHPSYPFGRPNASRGKEKGKSVGNLLGTVGGTAWELRGGGEGSGGWGGMGGGGGGGGGGAANGWKEQWRELGLREILENKNVKEIPPGMAGAKRPASPTSPSLHPSTDPQPKSLHLKHLYERKKIPQPHAEADQFDAAVPNELYPAEEGAEEEDTSGVIEQNSGMENSGMDEESDN